MTKITKEEKLSLLKAVLDDATFKAISSKPRKINEAFECNLSNLILLNRKGDLY